MNWGQIGSVIGAVAALLTVIFATHKYNSNQRDRIYVRLDETKEQFIKKVDTDFMRKDVCSEVHKRVDEKLKDIQEQTALIPTITAQLEILVNGRK